jgi:hypothetical protein
VTIVGAGPCHSSLYLSRILVVNEESMVPTMPEAGHDVPKGMEAAACDFDALSGSQPSEHHRSGIYDFGRLHCFFDLLVTPCARTMSTCKLKLC